MFDGLFKKCPYCTKLREIVVTFNDETQSQRDYRKGVCVWSVEPKTEVNTEVFSLDVCCPVCKNTEFVLTDDGMVLVDRLTPWLKALDEPKAKPF